MQNCQVQSILRGIPTLRRIDSSRTFESLLPSTERAPATAKNPDRKKVRRNAAALAEAIILQSIEDLWSKTNRKKSVEFFAGEGFGLCADMAGMKVVDRLRLLRMLRKLDPRLFDSRHAKKIGSIVNPQP
jgi:hypothetical protein